jgi:two-component system, OmpR family, sensor histidine kinase ChvG
MALDTNDAGLSVRLIEAPLEQVTTMQQKVGPQKTGRSWTTAVSDIRGPLSKWLARQPIPRFISASLWRRILISNLLGLLGLLLGMLYLSLHHGWLLDAKVDVVKTLSRITAEAIAYRAINENDRALFDPNRLPDTAKPRAQRDDAFSTLELPISPERAAPVLKKLIRPTDLQARIY